MNINHKLKIAPSQLRTCPRCQSPMLLMSAIPSKEPGLVTKLYECYVCHSTEQIERATKMAGWLASRELVRPI